MQRDDSRRAVKLCALEEISAPGGRGFTVDTGALPARIFVVHAGGMVRAYENSCPHVGTPLDWQPDQFLDAGGALIQCSTHGALFRIEDGYCIAGPCAGRSLREVKIEVRKGEVYLVSTEKAGLGTRDTRFGA